ncbi:MAG: hypothetical protein ACI8SK_000133 [Shewanella sp.]|jgi:hypothetical protein
MRISLLHFRVFVFGYVVVNAYLLKGLYRVQSLWWSD